MTERTGEREVVVTYRSKRKMCPVAKGIVKGVAAHYGERILITEPSCMLHGAGACEITVAAVG